MKNNLHLVIFTSLFLLIGKDIFAQSPIKFNNIPKLCSNADTIHLYDYVKPKIGLWNSESDGFVYPDAFIPKNAGVGTHWLKYEYNDVKTNKFFHDSIQVEVRPSPEVEIDNSNNLICHGRSYLGYANYKNADGIQWSKNELDDGSFELKNNKSNYVVYKPGKEDLKRTNFWLKIQTVHNDDICHPDYDSIQINIIDKPNTGFKVEKTAGFAPLSVSFEDTSTVNLFGLNCNWDFGDGINSNEKNPVHVYTEPGIYTVNLKVTDAVGCSEYLIKNNLVYVWSTDVSDNIIEQNLKISPLPAQGQTTISVGEGNGLIKSAILYNSTGKLVKQFSDVDNSQLVIQKDSQLDGLYFVHLKFDTGDEFLRKIIFK